MRTIEISKRLGTIQFDPLQITGTNPEIFRILILLQGISSYKICTFFS
ncbi:MAG: hypothetical protein KAQ69_08515 [Spirochaetales bacterium]|nr:hypothetical protein [Spirochaetales bacterium]